MFACCLFYLVLLLEVSRTKVHVDDNIVDHIRSINLQVQYWLLNASGRSNELYMQFRIKLTGLELLPDFVYLKF